MSVDTKNLQRRSIHRSNACENDENENKENEICDLENKKPSATRHTNIYPEIPELSISTENNDNVLNEEKECSKSSNDKREKSRKQETESNEKESLCNKLIYVMIFIIGMFLVPVFQFINNQLSLRTQPIVSPLLDVPYIVTTMQNHFSDQDDMNFRILRAALNSINSESEPKSPEILLLVSFSSDENLSINFSQKLAYEVSKAPIPISGTDLSKMDPNTAKITIDDTLSEKLSKDKLNVVLIHNLEKLSFRSAAIFHSYCDHENAPFKRVVYIMKISCLVKKTEESWDKIAHACLSEAWKDADEEVPALLSRITTRVMFLESTNNV